MSILRKYLYLILCIILFLSILVPGCASSKKKRKVQTGPVLVYSSEKDIPPWVTEIPEEKKYFYYVGSSGDSESFDAGKKESIGDALSQVVATIGITATASSSYEEQYFAEQYQTTLQTELLTEGKAKLQDAEVKEIYYEKYERTDGSAFFRVWILLKYSKDEIKKEQARLAEIIKLRYGEVGKFEEMAGKHREEGMLMDAVFAHVSAASAALKLDDGDVFFDRNMIRAGKLLLMMQLKKLGEDQIGWVGQPLENPLRLKVFYLDKGREVPIPNVPVKFSYRVPKARTAGYKLHVSTSVTDNEGIAGMYVDMVYEVSDRNRVDARIDLTSSLSQLQSAPSEYGGSIDSFKDILGTKEVTFLFKSDTHAREIRTAVYFLQLDENEEPLSKPVTAPVIYDVLYDKKFSIRVLDINPDAVHGKSGDEVWSRLIKSTGKGVKRIIFGTVRIVEFDTVSGFETAKASAEAVLYDRESGEIIRTWHIQRSGTGSSKESAQLNVLTELGKSLGEIISNTMP